MSDPATISVNDQIVWQNKTSDMQSQTEINHTDKEWRFQDVDLTQYAASGKVTLKFQLISDQGLELAFDHGEIIRTALASVRGRIEETNLAFELVPETFSIPELRAVFEVVKGTAYDPGNFRRRFNRLLADAVIQKAAGKRITRSKPAQVFRFRRDQKR